MIFALGFIGITISFLLYFHQSIQASNMLSFRSISSHLLMTAAFKSNTTSSCTANITGRFLNTISLSDDERLKYKEVLHKITNGNTFGKTQQELDQKNEKFYIPLYIYLKNKLNEHIDSYDKCKDANSLNKECHTLFVGISAPQGCGKTTLTTYLKKLFAYDGKLAVIMSLDDFYLTRKEQESLSMKYSTNPLLKHRGNAGTHDMRLMLSTLRSFKDNNQTILIPRYDKSLYDGRGDRVDTNLFEKVDQKVDIVLFEGWMLGFQSKNTEEEVSPTYQGLIEINNQLRHYKELHDIFDTWIVLALNDTNIVYKWRLQAEHDMKNSGKAALSDEDVKDFVSRFMPAYETYLPDLYKYGPDRRNSAVDSSRNADVLTIVMNDKRYPVSSYTTT